MAVAVLRLHDGGGVDGGGGHVDEGGGRRVGVCVVEGVAQPERVDEVGFCVVWGGFCEGGGGEGGFRFFVGW